MDTPVLADHKRLIYISPVQILDAIEYLSGAMNEKEKVKRLRTLKHDEMVNESNF